VTNAWQVECFANGSRVVVHAATQQAVQDKLYLDHPELRGIVRWVFEAPLRPKRPNDPPQQDWLLEHDTAFHRALVRRFHSDLVGDRTFTADQVLAITKHGPRGPERE
jgi:hypothetical protein